MNLRFLSQVYSVGREDSVVLLEFAADNKSVFLEVCTVHWSRPILHLITVNLPSSGSKSSCSSFLEEEDVPQSWSTAIGLKVCVSQSSEGSDTTRLIRVEIDSGKADSSFPAKANILKDFVHL